jgi:hypothetical protein
MRSQTIAADALPQRPDVLGVPYYVRGLALGISAYFIGVHLWTWIFMFGTFLGGRSDFRQLYTAGYMVRTGHKHQLYDYNAQLRYQNEVVSQAEIPLPFIRPAYEAWIFAPLSVLAYSSAYLLLLTINCGLVVICYCMLRPDMQNLAQIYPWLPAAIFLGFLPLAAALMQGQDSILFLLLLTISYRLLTSQWEFYAGLVLGAGAFKFQILIPIALLFFFWRRWCFFVGVLSTSLLALLISIATVGSEQTTIYVRSLIGFNDASGLSDLLRYPISPTLMANIHGLVTGIGEFVPLQRIQVLTLVLSLAVLAVLAFRQPARDAFFVAIPAGALVSYYLLIHDLTILLLPLLVMLNRNIIAGSRRIQIAATLMFVAPLCISYSAEHFYVVTLPTGLFLWSLLTDQRSTSAPYGTRDAAAHSFASRGAGG